MTPQKIITPAQLDWSASAPRSAQFDDIYFSGDGLAETHHVFLAGNDLPARFSRAARFTIGELGFGTGLNFLASWDAWRRAHKPPGARLHYFSVEAFPPHPDDLARAHGAWPDLRDLSVELRRRYPPLQGGFHRMQFAGGVSLTLFLGDALEALGRVELAADAWFLDGFSPEKNPQMWRPELMTALAALSNDDATCATFTAAGAVRRALCAAGFDMVKRPGFGAKREMLRGALVRPPQAASKRKPWFDTRKPPLPPGARVAVIGAGIAGASLAFALEQTGFQPILIDPAPGSGASGNPAGLIMPRLDLADTPAAQFHRQAYLYALRLLTEFGGDGFNPCGVLHHATGEKARKRQEKLIAQAVLPAGFIETCKEGLFFPQAGVVDPPAFVRAMSGDAAFVSARVKQVEQTAACWRVATDASDEECDAVVIANGLDALRFAAARALPLTGSAGQIDWFPDAAPPKHAHAFGPYAAPAAGGGLVIGATYEPVAFGAQPVTHAANTRANIAAVAETLPELAVKLTPAESTPRVSIRATTPDRLPIAGPLPDWEFYAQAYDGLHTGREGGRIMIGAPSRAGRRADYPRGEVLPGLYVLTGLGSRGFVTAPLAAAMIAAEMAGAPAPVDYAVAEALHPARFFIRDLKRAGAAS
jgi:tRNA 5-methylaminomethyl-2-thiouridine biosynthesis bifunctional protein